MKYFSKGKRGRIYLINDIAVKKSLARHIKNEVKFLKILNKHDIGPKLISSGKNYFKYKFVKGKFILDYLNENNKVKIKKVLIKILKQCRILDKLRINKKELTNPYKHIIINKKIAMIDFERCYFTDKPKNVSQFCQFLMSNKVKEIFKRKKININKNKLIKILKVYKKSYSEKDFKNVLKIISR